MRLPPEARKTLISTTAHKVAIKDGLAAVTAETVAKLCIPATSPSTVRYHFPTVTELWQSALGHDTDGVLIDQAVSLGIVKNDG